MKLELMLREYICWNHVMDDFNILVWDDYQWKLFEHIIVAIVKRKM